ncbi:isoprenyl transferase [Porphyromonas sp.]|uniref:isoprenyl transferase n=1 Tax=Porphyromonas sp. TaxID=1924944 RepID=UPI0026DCE927|nr:isoprenyl transferase [Porphyromonas sp.]MDO4770939.1 isoprenyl transferase [Porphyromonas sp.]
MLQSSNATLNLTPHHVAIIMDGNGRWAQAQSKERAYGHIHGIEPVRTVIKAAVDAGVKVLTLYTFSEENWNRPRSEVDALMSLLVTSIKNEIEELSEKGVRLQAIGAIEKLPPLALQALQEAIDATSHNNTITLVLALSYSSRKEMISAVQEIAKDVARGTLAAEDIDEETITSRLYTHGLPEPDLLIRTGGECRISNFLLWQIAYTELYFCDVFWPDFGKDDFLKAIEDYKSRQRRFGKTGEQVIAPEENKG